MPRRVMGLIVMLAVAVLDQIAKWLVFTEIAPGEHDRVEVLPFFALVHWWNRGISFGVLNGLDRPELQRAVLVLLTLAIMVILAVNLKRAERTLPAFAFGLIMGGALGNLIDRLHYGAVADFLYFHYRSYDFPAFNVADSCVCIGVGLLLLDSTGLGRAKSASFHSS